MRGVGSSSAEVAVAPQAAGQQLENQRPEGGGKATGGRQRREEVCVTVPTAIHAVRVVFVIGLWQLRRVLKPIQHSVVGGLYQGPRGVISSQR